MTELSRGASSADVARYNLVRKVEATHAALLELVVLNGIKDRDRQTADYKARQPAAWKAAREALLLWGEQP